jgi:CRISPR-associated Cas5-like protein
LNLFRQASKSGLPKEYFSGSDAIESGMSCAGFGTMKTYPVQMEISGATAMWPRPDTGSSPVSYVAPTYSAVKGIFESVLRWKSVRVRPVKVEICRPVQFHRDAYRQYRERLSLLFAV